MSNFVRFDRKFDPLRQISSLAAAVYPKIAEIFTRENLIFIKKFVIIYIEDERRGKMNRPLSPSRQETNRKFEKF
jgi:hypothetical protein